MSGQARTFWRMLAFVPAASILGYMVAELWVRLG